MNDPLLVRGFEGLGDLLRDRRYFVDRHSGLPRRSARRAKAGNALREIVALDQFHHQGQRATGAFKAVDGRDVGMIQGRERLRFPLEAGKALGILSERIGQHLDCDLAAEARIGRTIDGAHSAFADRRDDVVDAESSAGSERQVPESIAATCVRTSLLMQHGWIATGRG